MPWSAKGTACVLAVIAAITLACWPLIEYGPHTGDSPSKGRDKPLVVSLLLIFAGAWFLMTPLSTPVWHYFPVLQKVQFPWRVMVIQEFAVVSTLILALGCCLENRRRALLLFAAALKVSVSSWVTYMTFSGYREHLTLSNDPALQRGFHFQTVAGREAAAKGDLLEITPTPEFELLAFQAPAGQYQAELKLRTLWPEKLGWAFSGAASLAMLLIPAGPRMRRIRRRGA